MVQQAAKKAVKTVLAKATAAVKKETLKRGIDNPLVDMALNAASKKAEAEVGL